MVVFNISITELGLQNGKENFENYKIGVTKLGLQNGILNFLANGLNFEKAINNKFSI